MLRGIVVAMPDGIIRIGGSAVIGRIGLVERWQRWRPHDLIDFVLLGCERLGVVGQVWPPNQKRRTSSGE